MDSKSLGRVVYGSDANDINRTPATGRHRPHASSWPPARSFISGSCLSSARTVSDPPLEFAASEPRPAPVTE